MPANWEPLASQTVSEVISPTKIREVEQITARALPSRVVFYVRLPDILQDPVNTAEIVGLWADWINEVAATPGVVGVTWVQDIDTSDQLEDTIVLTVASSSGTLTADVTVRDIGPGSSTYKRQVDTARAALNQIEAG